MHRHPIKALYHLLDQYNAWQANQILARNAMLKTEGSVDINIYYIESGSIRIFLYSEEEEHTIRFGYERNFITAPDSFISEQPSDLYMQAIRKTKVKWVSRPRYMEIVNSKPEYIALYNQLLEQLVLQQMEREQDLLINSPEERYRRVLQRSPQLFQEVPHKYIASYLRMTPGDALSYQKALISINDFLREAQHLCQKENMKIHWDFAATACIYQELGLPATDFEGGKLDLNRQGSTFMNHQGVFFLI